MEFYPHLGMNINGHEFNYKFFQTLKCVSKTWSQRKAAIKLGVSPAVLNRRILDAENKLGFQILKATGAGSELTPEGINILEQYNRYVSRIKDSDRLLISGGHISSGLLEVLASESGLEVSCYSSDDESAFYLAKKDFLDIMSLDDPLLAFQNDLDFTPIAYDYLVLVSSPGCEVSDIKELKNGKFVAVSSSSQRLAWKTLEDDSIPFEIYNEAKSPYEAFKMVKNSKNLHTFLNGSFFQGEDLLKEETRHIISLVNFRGFNPKIEEFITYILGPGQKIVEKQGFGPL
ncbi:MAG: LysR family transcriptional regulator [Euryarchaeota archaeon]|nr:LysR family transcriptional regulator [Euryarchaeota archaeon]MBU4607545.1 LysR family transcriptional regulator [Euryarchaeota archaeon]MBV1728885.1 LysR family transcriptional regulator [Methanobacterium sp.]MBV1754142.1 LysR family transcriptional regulator [Methanobacterium sp.]MBV1767023.1 LysR family transcriptional regulator [Methanobacterium sp.]